MYKFLLRAYLKLHMKYHGWIIASLQQRMDGGLHYTNKFNRRYEWFLENLCEKDTVLDIACGTGTILKKTAGKFVKGYGIEINNNNLKLCRLDAPENIEFIPGDIFKFDYKNFIHDKKITVCILSHILEHIEDPSTFLKQFKAEKLLICVPSEEHSYADFIKSLGLSYTTDNTHFREYSRDVLKDHLVRSGYNVEYSGFNQEGEIVCKAVALKINT